MSCVKINYEKCIKHDTSRLQVKIDLRTLIFGDFSDFSNDHNVRLQTFY